MSKDKRNYKDPEGSKHNSAVPYKRIYKKPLKDLTLDDVLMWEADINGCRTKWEKRKNGLSK